MITRHFSAEKINTIINEPSVYEWVKGRFKGYMDLTPVIADLRNVLLVGEFGGTLFIQHQPGFYEVHTQVLPSGRGKWTLKMVQDSLKWMFTKTEAVEIFTKVPKGNLGARALVRAIHGSLEFRNKRGWVVKDEVVYADMFSLNIQTWVRTAPDLETRGKWFHDKLEAEYKKKNKVEPNHEDDPIHDRYVGCAVETILGGQAQKAVVFYNRWARMAGYADIKIVTSSPLVLDIQDALLMVRDQDFWVMTCQ